MREDEAHDLRWVEIIRHLDHIRLQNTHSLRVRPPHRQRADTVTDPQPRAFRSELFDDPDEFIAGREGGLGYTEIRPGAEHGVGVRHAGRKDPDANLARPRPG